MMGRAAWSCFHDVDSFMTLPPGSGSGGSGGVDSDGGGRDGRNDGHDRSTTAEISQPTHTTTSTHTLCNHIINRNSSRVYRSRCSECHRAHPRLGRPWPLARHGAIVDR